MRVYGYVVMPEPVHLLVSEPDTDTLADAMHFLKLSFTKSLHFKASFWQNDIMIAMFEMRMSSMKSWGTFTTIQSSVGWRNNLRTGSGAVFGTMLSARLVW
jgi:hypothetical protein